jgi:hypothetical protein
VFDPGLVKQDRPGPGADRLLVAKLTGEARHHARWRPLTEEEETAAVAGFRDLAGGRADLLAEVAGLLLGFHAGDLEEPRARTAAQLCRLAGADEALIPQWTAEGRRKAEIRRKPPFSAPSRRRPG